MARNKIKNKRGELFQVGDEVMNCGWDKSGNTCGLAEGMKHQVGLWFTVNSFVDPIRGVLRVNGSEYAWHMDDFTFQADLVQNDRLSKKDLPKNFTKWMNLKSELYKRWHTNEYIFFIEDDDKPATWTELVDSQDLAHFHYYNNGNVKRVVDREGTHAYKALKCGTQSCYGGFMGSYAAFRQHYSQHATHTMHKMKILTPPQLARIMGYESGPGFQYPTVAQWKEAMLHFKRGGMIQDDWDLDAIFADEDAIELFFKIDMRKLSKERWYWYACMIRYLAENPRMLHAFNGLLKDNPNIHPITALVCVSAVYHGRTHAAVECGGMVSADIKGALIDAKDMVLYVARVKKFLTVMPGDRLLVKESKNFPMWRIFKYFREQSSIHESRTSSVYGVRPPKKAYVDASTMFGYNPDTREVK